MALFEARGLHKRFGHQVVLESISLSFEEGQLSGIMGPNGAGKTTCFNVLTGHYAPDRGNVVFAGEDITAIPAEAPQTQIIDLMAALRASIAKAEGEQKPAARKPAKRAEKPKEAPSVEKPSRSRKRAAS